MITDGGAVMASLFLFVEIFSIIKKVIVNGK